MKPLRPATPAARKLLLKLQALANAPGTPDEGAAAAKKLARLKAKYDFTPPDITKEGLFAGHYQPSPNAVPILSIHDASIGFWVKWAIEASTNIPCLFRGSELFAQASPRTAAKLSTISRTIATGFVDLWDRFRTFPAITAEDRLIFLRGLYDGMMNEQKPQGQPLPQRCGANSVMRKAKRQAVTPPAHLGLHPYTIALGLGQQIRFNVPLPDIASQLDQLKPREIAA